MTEPLIELSNVKFSYANGRSSGPEQWFLRLDRIKIMPRSVYQVVGDNMAGKTTFLRVIGGLEPVGIASNTQIKGSLLSGSFRVGTSKRLDPINTCFLSHSDQMFPELTLWQNVVIGKSCGPPVRRKEARQRFGRYVSASDVLRKAGNLNHRGTTEGCRFGELSSGGQALAKIARAYTWRPELILIDEISAHLDRGNAESFYRNLDSLFDGRGCALVLVSHVARDHVLASAVASRVGAAHSQIQIRLQDGASCATVHTY
jgi:ABC-type molybdenum transport system ATPase subunit/photorepair protein PhrA